MGAREANTCSEFDGHDVDCNYSQITGGVRSFHDFESTEHSPDRGKFNRVDNPGNRPHLQSVSRIVKSEA